MDSLSERSEKRSVVFDPAVTASDVKHEEAVMAVLAENTVKVLDSEDADVDIWQGRRIGPIKLPLMFDAKWRKWWDLLVCVILLYVATVSIYVICFYGILWIDSPLFWLERCIDVVWVTDICLNFLTSYQRGDRTWEMSLRKCSLRYLFGWFIVDFVSTVPWDIIGYTQEGEDASYWQILRLLRLLRLLKMSKLVRVVESSKLLVRVEVFFCVKYAILRICILVIGALFVAHWVACLFYFFAFVQVGIPGVVTWIDDLADASNNFEFYIASLYFSVYTITTIGYGDVTPNTTIERIYTTIIMLMGAAIFAYLLSNVNALVSDLNVQGAQYRLIMDQLSDYATSRQLDPQIHFKVRQYFKQIYRNSQLVSSDDVVLDSMTPELRCEVTIAVYGPLVQKVEWFDNIDHRILGRLCTVVEQRTFSPNEHVYLDGDEPTGIYIVIHGSVSHFGANGRLVGESHDADVFGVENVVLGRKRDSTAITNGYVNTLFIERNRVLEALESSGQYDAIVHEEVQRLWKQAVIIAQEHAHFLHLANELYRFVKCLEQSQVDPSRAFTLMRERKKSKSLKAFFAQLAEEVSIPEEADTDRDSDDSIFEQPTSEERRRSQIDELRDKLRSSQLVLLECLEKLNDLE